MKRLYKKTKAWLSFQMGQNPVTEQKRADFRSFIPEPYDGVVMVSADFELAWAWRFDKLNPNPKENSILLAKKERNNIPKLLELSEKYHIPITWGTVGHLFLEKCNCENEIVHPEIHRLPYFENDWWKYEKGDWFADDPCGGVQEAPSWYAPDLVSQIINSPVKHEIACHSFSHISCDNGICSPDVLMSELDASQKAADKFGIQLRSFIFPGHTMGNYDTLAQAGYSSMRTNFINTIGYPVKHNNGIWEHKTTMELNYNPLFSIKMNIARLKKIIDKSINKNLVCNFWFHPSFDAVSLESVVPEVFKIINNRKRKLWVTTMQEYTRWLNSNENS